MKTRTHARIGANRHSSRRPDPSPTPQAAAVLRVDAPGSFTLQAGSRLVQARRALSCLLEPQAGDRVAWLLMAPDEAWIVALLDRPGEAGATLSCPGSLRIEAHALALAAPSVQIEGEELGVRARQLRVNSDDAQLDAGTVRLMGAVVKVVGSVLSTVFDRVTHYSQQHLRTTKGLDRVHATHLECEAQELMRLSGKHALINGEKLVKTRGAQIHFG